MEALARPLSGGMEGHLPRKPASVIENRQNWDETRNLRDHTMKFGFGWSAVVKYKLLFAVNRYMKPRVVV